MDYPIPENLKEIIELERQPVSPEVVASAIAGVVQISHHQGKTLDDLIREVLTDDRILDATQRDWLRNIVAQTWEAFTIKREE
ncbi:MAG: hypothetical protein J7641_12965 [Cyanobacteria bacterium SID2]|nr:hypothetical protein [Cyanobacteria bacterium SID2]MBP0004922.1 hypothetical protein [Cyanobacteria bacterium SBC]